MVFHVLGKGSGDSAVIFTADNGTPVRKAGQKVCGAAATLILLLAAGCAHPCGYVDIHTRFVPLGDAEDTGRLSAVESLRVVQDISPETAVIEGRFERREVKTGLAAQETYGRLTSARYAWYAPILKPVTAVTVVLPLYFSAHNKHCHGVGNWTAFDYLRDVVSWFNPFSAVPLGPRVVDGYKRLVRSRVIEATLEEKLLAVAGRTVALYLDDRKLAMGMTNADGMVEFDLARYLTADDASEDRTLVLASAGPEGEAAELTLPLPRDLMKQILGAREEMPLPPDR